MYLGGSLKTSHGIGSVQVHSVRIIFVFVLHIAPKSLTDSAAQMSSRHKSSDACDAARNLPAFLGTSVTVIIGGCPLYHH